MGACQIQHGEPRRFVMSAPIPLPQDFDASELRGLARRSKDGPQARRLLALAAIYDGATRTEAAKIGGVGLQIIRDWVLRFNARGPNALVNGKSPGHGQVRELLDIFGWALSFDGCASRPTEASYSSSSSFLTAAICRRSNSVTLTERHRSAARMSAPNISFKTALSPNAFGMILRRRRSSTKRRSSKFVVRMARRCATGNRRWAIQASKSSMKQATALSYLRP